MDLDFSITLAFIYNIMLFISRRDVFIGDVKCIDTNNTIFKNIVENQNWNTDFIDNNY